MISQCSGAFGGLTQVFEDDGFLKPYPAGRCVLINEVVILPCDKVIRSAADNPEEAREQAPSPIFATLQEGSPPPRPCDIMQKVNREHGSGWQRGGLQREAVAVLRVRQAGRGRDEQAPQFVRAARSQSNGCGAAHAVTDQ